MDDDESAWDKDEVIEFTEERVFPALSFLQEQAERWGVNLSFEVKRYFTALSEGLDMTYKGTVIKDLLFRARPRTCLSRPLRFWALLRAWSCSRRLWGIRNDKLIPLMLIQNGGMRGYLAYHAGKAVGWCNANDKRSYHTVLSSLFDDTEDTEKVKSIVCFCIAKEMRNKGIATRLLEKVCEDAACEGYEYVEVYPYAHGQDHDFHGPLTMYEKRGFIRVGRQTEGCIIMRKNLR